MNAFPTADTIGSTIDISMSKAPVLEAVSLTEAAMQDGERRTEPAISNERIALNNVLLGTYKVISDAIPGGMIELRIFTFSLLYGKATVRRPPDLKSFLAFFRNRRGIGKC